MNAISKWKRNCKWTVRRKRDPNNHELDLGASENLEYPKNTTYKPPVFILMTMRRSSIGLLHEELIAAVFPNPWFSRLSDDYELLPTTEEF